MNIKNKSTLLVLAITLFGFSSFAQTKVTGEQAADTEGTEIQDNGAEPDQAEAQVQEIKIDEDELPGESVTPKTDISNAVVNKAIRFTKKFTVDLGYGSVLDEPLLNTNYYLFRGSYFINEDYSFGIGIKSRFGGKSDYAQQLFNSSTLEFDRAPAPTQSHFVSFGYVFYYGKMSFSKNAVIPATTKLDSDFGMQKVGATEKPFIQSAITQSFFLNKHFSLGLSYGFMLAQSYDPTSVNIRSAQPVPKESDFTEKLQFNQYLSANVSALF